MFCHNCGNKLEEGVKFCSNCGTKVKDNDEEKDKEISKTTDSNGKDGDNEFSYAGFWKRLAAYIIDTILFAIPSFVIGILVGFYDIPLSDNTFLFISTFAVWIYFAGMESSSRQATLGKQALGIIVTDENGSRISFARATGRHFAKFISSLLLLIGYIMVAFTEKKQGLHDMIASCLVINKDK